LYNRRKKELESLKGKPLSEEDTPEWLSELDNDTNLHDCSISEIGVQQAKTLTEKLRALKIDVVVTSPLRRAIMTMFQSQVLEHKGHELKEVVVHPSCIERLESSSEWGNFPEDLQHEFPKLSFGHLPSVYWYQPFGVELPVKSSKEWTIELKNKYWSSVRKHTLKVDPFVEPLDHMHNRVQKFKEWIISRPENYFLVFSHADFLQGLTGKKLDNCELTTIYL